ncbi:hypothetical protein GWK47_016971 [Chionoecetes opilio]|uniref:Uncharacterized protein n=1 Tax=Chionoecetes opilio TaxID=41210 RepID=A0A8J4XWA8_CHIOP|nr:hypothetical protein GWK47_016971 [Chionoecetes opilio]
MSKCVPGVKSCGGHHEASLSSSEQWMIQSIRALFIADGASCQAFPGIAVSPKFSANGLWKDAKLENRILPRVICRDTGGEEAGGDDKIRGGETRAFFCSRPTPETPKASVCNGTLRVRSQAVVLFLLKETKVTFSVSFPAEGTSNPKNHTPVAAFRDHDSEEISYRD